MRAGVIALVALASCSVAAPPERAQARRIVSVGGPVTECVFALGAGPEVVGVDTSSLFPDAAAKLPKVGYQRRLSAEGVLGLRPDLVLLGADAGPPAAVAQLRAAGIRVVVTPAAQSLEGARALVRAVGAALGRAPEAERLVERLDAEIARAQTPRPGPRPRVAFVYARGGGTLQVAGEGTGAAEMIRLAGGENAVVGYRGYKPLSSEGLVAADPDVLLFTTRGLAALGGLDGALALPGVALTRAGRARRVRAVDDLLLLGFGPRTGAGVAELARRLGDGAP